MLTVDETYTILVKATPNLPSRFDQNDFIDLFLDDGPFEYLREVLFGITTHNYVNKIFAVNFDPNATSFNSTIIQNFLERFKNPCTLRTATGENITVSATTPPKPLQMITLHPMPFNVSPEQLTILTRG